MRRYAPRVTPKRELKRELKHEKKEAKQSRGRLSLIEQDRHRLILEEALLKARKAEIEKRLLETEQMKSALNENLAKMKNALQDILGENPVIEASTSGAKPIGLPDSTARDLFFARPPTTTANPPAETKRPRMDGQVSS